MEAAPTAVVLTVGNEIVSGDVENTNASWLSRRLAAIGLEVTLLAAVRDDVDEIAVFLRAESPRAGYVFVTGGLGGTPDDITRESVAAAFGVPCEEIDWLAATCGAASPAGASATTRRAGRACPRVRSRSRTRSAARPGFVIQNVYVFPGLPSEMKAMFDEIAPRFQGRPVAAWRRRYRTGEGQIVGVLEEATKLHPAVDVGSYPRFLDDGPEVEVVLKSTDEAALADATRWLPRRSAASRSRRSTKSGAPGCPGPSTYLLELEVGPVERAVREADHETAARTCPGLSVFQT